MVSSVYFELIAKAACDEIPNSLQEKIKPCKETHLKGELQTPKFLPLWQCTMNALSIRQDPRGNQHALAQTRGLVTLTQ